MYLIKSVNNTLKLVLISLMFGSISQSNAQESKTPIQITDMLKIKNISNLELSPDGSKILYQVKSIVTDSTKKSTYNYLDQIWQQPLSNETAAKATAISSAQQSASQAAYDPKGEKIAFVRTIEGQSQLFLLDLQGGEAQQLTHFKYGASQPIWSPDGRSIVFSTSVTLDQLLDDDFLREDKLDTPSWSLEKPGLNWQHAGFSKSQPTNPDGSIEEIRAYLKQNQREGKAKVINQTRFQTENNATDELKFNHYYRVELDRPDQVLPLANGFKSYRNLHYWGDSEVLINVSNSADLHPDRHYGSSLFKINVESLRASELIAQDLYQNTLLNVDYASEQLVFARSEQDSLSNPEIFVWNIKDSPRQLSFDLTASNFKFADRGKSLYFVSEEDGGRVLHKVNLRDLKVDKLTTVDEGISDYVLTKHAGLVAIVANAANPSEIKSFDASGRYQKDLTAINSSWLANRKLAAWEKFKFKNDIGQEISYWLVKSDASLTSALPLLVQIHGGPASMFGPSDASMWLEYQFFAAQGYAVLLGNPRGSNGYGVNFLKSNYRNWGVGPGSDVLKAVDLTLQNNTQIDSNNLFLTGGSYGGYLTTWIMAHDHRFAAASSQRGVYDVTTFFGEGNVWPMVKRYFGGYPWEDGIAEVLHEASVLDVADQIRTPLLIFHGEQDLRTGIAQSERLYKTLKVLDRPVEYVRHPGANHEITRSGNVEQRIDQMLRTYEFFERYRKDTK